MIRQNFLNFEAACSFVNRSTFRYRKNTAFILSVGTTSRQSSLNPRARNQRSVQSRCSYVRFFGRNGMPFISQKREIFAQSNRAPGAYFAAMAKRKIDKMFATGEFTRYYSQQHKSDIRSKRMCRSPLRFQSIRALIHIR